MDTSIIVLIILGLLLFSAFKILREYERGVIFMLGRFWKVKGPGLIIVIPGIQKMVKVIQKLGKEKKYTEILDQKIGLYFDKAHDLTNLAVLAYDKIDR